MRRILNIKWKDKVTNVEVRERAGIKVNENILNLIQKRQSMWLGHVLRMDKQRIPNMLLFHQLDGKRRQGKPRTTWLGTNIERVGMGLHQANTTAGCRTSWKAVNDVAGAYVRPRTRST